MSETRCHRKHHHHHPHHRYLSLVEHHDAVCGEDSVEPVSDDQGGAVLKRTPDSLLDQSVRLCVHGCSGLVKDQDLPDRRQLIRRKNPGGGGGCGHVTRPSYFTLSQ